MKSFFFSIQQANNSLLQKMWTMITEFSQNGKNVLSTNVAEHLRMVHEGNYAFLIDETTVRFEMGNTCELKILRERLLPVGQAMGFQKNSVYLEIFNQAYVILQRFF